MVTVAPVVALSEVAGDHVYVVAPLAVSDADAPLQIVADDGVTLTVGVGLTVTVLVAVFVQPFAPVPVIVYVVVTVGDAVTEAPVVALRPVAGDHV